MARPKTAAERYDPLRASQIIPRGKREIFFGGEKRGERALSREVRRAETDQAAAVTAFIFGKIATRDPLSGE